jgi:rare lipoprotein A
LSPAQRKTAILILLDYRVLRTALLGGLALTIANCAGTKTSCLDPKYGVCPSPKVVADGQSVPKGGGYSKVGQPYVIAGETYTPKNFTRYSAVGMASWYGSQFRGRMTANGEVFDLNSVTAAHPTIPLPSYIRVTNTANGRSIIARVNDRGPFHSKRLIDVSERVAEALDFRRIGTARVKVDYVGRAPIEGSDDNILMASLKTDGSMAYLKGDAKAPIQVANAESDSSVFADALPQDQKSSFSLFSSAAAASEVVANSSIGDQTQSTEIDAFVPLPPIRPRNLLAAVSLIPARSMLTRSSTAFITSSVQTASIVPMPVPRPGVPTIVTQHAGTSY